MPRITVTGATGQFGNLVIKNLLERGVPAQAIRASVRDVSKASHHQARGIDVRRGDFDDPDALNTAFEDTENLLIISTDKIGSRVEQHRRAAAAARAAGVRRIAYTSVVDMGSGNSTNPIAVDHRATEQIIRDTQIPFTFLRNTFYAEYMLAPVVQAVDSGVFVSSAGDARLGAAARSDLAAAAAVALLETDDENRIYELTYPQAWDFREAVAIVSEASGKPLVYRPVPDEEMEQALRQAGLPAEVVQMTLGMNRALRQGDLAQTTNDLGHLLHRPVTPLSEIARSLLVG